MNRTDKNHPGHETKSTDFYVGYKAQAPQRLAQFLRQRIVALYVLAAIFAIVAVLAQAPFAIAFFEFGNQRDFDGFISEHPYPTLLVERPETDGTDQMPFSRYLLTVFGKQGAGTQVAGLDGKRVRLNGTLIYRDGQTMVELVEGSVQVIDDDPLAAGGSTMASSRASIGWHKLVGEIIDSKCYLGVMKPGNLKPHRSCAIRCISGGVPPIFVARDEADNMLQLLMVGADDRTLNKEVLDFVADQIELEGEIVRDGGMLILKTEPASFRRRY